MKVIIAGGRGFNNKQLLFEKCDNILKNKDVVEIVSGVAKGADYLGELYGEARGYYVKRFKANWDRYGKSAGFLRNKEMAEYADALIAFWDGQSKGTAHMIELAKKQGLLIRVIRYDKLTQH